VGRVVVVGASVVVVGFARVLLTSRHAATNTAAQRR
jgi:hypothetical protein